MTRSLASVLVVILVGACGDDGTGEDEDTSATASATGSTSAGTSEATGDPGGSSTQSSVGSESESVSASATATVGESESAGTGTTGDPEALAPIYGVPNLDDDDKNGKADWYDPTFAGDNDLVAWSLPAWYTATLQPGDKVELSLAGEAGSVRFWRGSEVVLGDGGGPPITSAVLDASAASEAMSVEFGDFLRIADLTVRHLDASDGELARETVRVISAPMMTEHHLQNAEYVWAVPVSSNKSMIADIKAVVGDRFISVPSDDVWIQDELEWALATAPGQRLNIAVDSIRDRPLDAYVKSLKAPDVQPITWGQEGTQTTEDKFGNLETTPPHSAGGVDYPFGRIYYGHGPTCGPNQILRDHLARQKVQRPIEVNTCWLCVGHVDEFISFIPDPSSPKGFKFLIADVDAAYAILDALPGNTSIPRYGQGHGYSTIGSIVNDNALRALNQDLQSDYIDAAREKIKAELGLDESDIIRLPGLFEKVNGCSYKSNGVAAMIPGMLNLVVVNFAGEPLRIFVSDPFLRSNDGDQGSDPLIANFKAKLPPEYEIHFVDDWYTYHLLIGEVHCGTNVARSPAAHWWEDGLALIDGP